MSTTAYNLYIGWTTVRDLIFRVTPTTVLVQLRNRALRIEAAYLRGRAHTDDQYDRVADRSIILDQIIEDRA